jgi:hypothetical protein
LNFWKKGKSYNYSQINSIYRIYKQLEVKMQKGLYNAGRYISFISKARKDDKIEFLPASDSTPVDDLVRILRNTDSAYEVIDTFTVGEIIPRDKLYQIYRVGEDGEYKGHTRFARDVLEILLNRPLASSTYHKPSMPSITG